MSRLADIRRQSGLSQTVLAEKIGITQARLSHYENGSRNIPQAILEKIAEKLNYPIEELKGFGTLGRKKLLVLIGGLKQNHIEHLLSYTEFLLSKDAK